MDLAVRVVVRPGRALPSAEEVRAVAEAHERESPIVGCVALDLHVELRPAVAPAESLREGAASGEADEENGERRAAAEDPIHFRPSSSRICLLLSARSVSSRSSSLV